MTDLHVGPWILLSFYKYLKKKKMFSFYLYPSVCVWYYGLYQAMGAMHIYRGLINLYDI